MDTSQRPDPNEKRQRFPACGEFCKVVLRPLKNGLVQLRGLRTSMSLPGRYTLAILIYLVAFALRLWIFPPEAGLPYLTFYPAVVITLYLCGLGPGALATALCALTAYDAFLPPYWSLAPSYNSVVSVSVFLFSTFLIGALVGELQMALTRLARTSSQLKQSERHFRGMLEDQNDVICRYKADGTILYVNDAFCRLFGKAREDLVGRIWHPIAWHEDVPLIEEKLNSLSPAHPVALIENRVVATGNRIVWGEFLNRAFFDDRGKLLEILSTGRDIDERKRIEAQLRESEARFRNLIDANRAVILQIDPADGRILDANPAAADFYGWPRSQLCAMSIQDLRSIDPAQVALERESAVRGERNYFVTRHRLASGEWRDVEVHSTPIPFGTDILLVSIIHDITARVRSEARTDELLQEQRAILDSQIVGILKLRDRNCVWANPTVSDMFGYSLDELIGRPSRMVFPSEQDYLEFGASAYAALARGEVYRGTHQLVCKDGTMGWYEVTGNRLKRGNGESLWMVVDVTARHATERALEEALRESADLYNNAPSGYHSVGPDGTVLRINDTELKWLGYEREEVVGRLKIADLLASGSAEQSRDNLRGLIETGQRLNLQVEFLRKDGSTLPTLVNASSMTDEHGRFRMSRTTVVDRTELQKVEKALQKESEKNRALLRNASDGIHILDLDGRLLECSDSFCTMLGYTRNELIGMHFTRWDCARNEAEGMALLATQHAGKERSEFESVHRRKDGSEFPVELSGFPLELDGKPVMFYSSRDITERKRMDAVINHLAFFDTLTQLPNRRLLADRMNQAMAESMRNAFYCALLLLDLDKFKMLNDSHGHAMGDVLLYEAAARLVASVREFDTVARFGGDEFVLILRDLDRDRARSIVEARIVAERIRVALAEPCHLILKRDAQADIVVDYSCSVSIGLTVFVGHESMQHELLMQADALMYEAKKIGGNCVVACPEEVATLPA